MCELGPTKINELVIYLRAQPLVPMAFSTYRDHLDQFFDGSDNAAVFERSTMSIAAFRRDQALGSAEALDIVFDGCEEDGWSQAELELGRVVKPALAHLLDTELIVRTEKYISMSYEYDKKLQGSNIFTDMRPVFDASREYVAGSLVVQTLRLEFSGPDHRTVEHSYTLDIDDIQRLRDDCEHALRKSAAIEKFMSENESVSTIVLGKASK